MQHRIQTKLQRLLSLALVWVIPFVVNAQTPIVQTLSLPSSVRNIPVTQFAQDASGMLWLGGDGMLMVYDGLEMHRQLPNEQLPNVRVTALYTETDGTVWVGHRTGDITRYLHGEFTPYNPPEGHPAVPVSAFLRDGRGYLWYGTNGEGLYYDIGERVYLLDPGTTGFPDESVHCLLADSNNCIWAGTDAGFCKLTPEGMGFQVQAFSQSNGLPDNLVKGLAWAPDHNLWVAMQDSGLISFNPENRRFTRPFPWTYGSLLQISVAEDGSVWMATQSGLLLYDPSSKQTTLFTKRVGMPANNTRAVFIDRENTLWTSASDEDNHAVGHLLGDRFRFVNERDGLSSKNVSSVFSDSRGSYWIGTDKGITRYTPGDNSQLQVSYFLNTPNLSKEARWVVSLAEDSRGNIWAGTFGGGVFRINPTTNRVERFTTKDGLGNDNVFSIVRGNDLSMWLGTQGGGVTQVRLTTDKPTFQTYTSEDGLTGDYVYCVFFGKDGNLYVGTDGTGFSIYDGKSFKNFGEAEGLPSGTVYRISQSATGTLYLLTPDQGVVTFDGSTFKQLSTLDLSEGQEANAMVVGGGNLIVAGPASLGRFNQSASSAALYDENDGLRKFEPNLNAIHADKDGIVWIGTSDGVVRYNPNTQSPSETPPRVAITRFRVFLEDQPMTAGLSLGYADNNITFDFLGVNLASPNRVRYQYMLVGQDKDWSLETQSRFVTYPNLPPGDYTFKVRASINPGQWTPEPASYAFTVRPPFWMTWWFLTLSIVGLVLGTYRYFRWRIARVQRENLILEQKVEERTREVVEQKEIIEAKNDQLEQANQNITESIVYASRIQEAILPEMQRIDGRLKELMVCYRAKDIVSGDFYWFEQQDTYTYLAAVDCTGHGVPGALLSVMGYNLLNQIVYQHPGVAPDEMLRLLDRGIYDALRRKMGTERAPNDGMDVALCLVDHARNQLLFSGAYRPLYYISGDELHEIKGSRYPIGGGYEGKEFELHTLPYKPGDRFYIFSDGLVDQFGGPQGRKFTPGRLKRILTENLHMPLQEQQALISNTFSEWLGDFEQLDDVMLIGFQPL